MQEICVDIPFMAINISVHKVSAEQVFSNFVIYHLVYNIIMRRLFMILKDIVCTATQILRYLDQSLMRQNPNNENQTYM